MTLAVIAALRSPYFLLRSETEIAVLDIGLILSHLSHEQEDLGLPAT